MCAQQPLMLSTVTFFLCTSHVITGHGVHNNGNVSTRAGSFAFELDISSHNIHTIDDEELPGNVSALISHHNPLTYISDHAFNESAITLKAIDIQFHEITSLPVQALSDLQSLNSLTINHGNLTSISKEVSDILPKLTYLDLSFNGLTDLTNISIFQNAPKLYQIKLNYNNIVDITPLYNMTDVLRISLSGNKICSVTPPSTSNMTGKLPTTLLYLWMEDNCLTRLPDFAFMTDLQVLVLSNNNITNSAKDTFPASLLILELTNNAFRWIPHTVSSLTQLMQLKMSGNRVQSLDTFVFPSSLTFIFLKQNRLHQIHTTIHFTNSTSSLTILDLSENPLTSISDDAFDQLVHLQTLNLTETQLTRLPMALNKLTHLNSLYMVSVANLTCSCLEASLATPLAHVHYMYGKCLGGSEIKFFLNTLAKQCPSS